MNRQFLVYWQSGQIRDAIACGFLDHAASNQFGRIMPGDVIWIVGKGRTEPLITIGPLAVKRIVSQEEAERILPYPPWEAKYHVLANGQETITRKVSLAPILGELTFISDGNSKLDLTKPLGWQLQTIRHLSEESASRIQQLWNQAIEADHTEFKEIQDELDSYEDLDRPVVVLARREQAFLRRHLFKGDDTGICIICGEELPVSVLVAAHVKPRGQCNDTERRDYINNVVPMCLFGCDSLFERGFIVVEGDTVRVRKNTQKKSKLSCYLRQVNGRRLVSLTPNSRNYFNWHYNYHRSME